MFAPPPTSPSPSRQSPAELPPDLEEPLESAEEQHWTSQEDLELNGGGRCRIYWWTKPKQSGQAREGTENPDVLLCLHGAGDSGVTWSSVASRLMASENPEHLTILQAVAAVDLRGHGAFVAESEEADKDLRIERLVSDVLEAATAISTAKGGAGIVLAGHSLGGAVATRVAAAGLQRKPPLRVRSVLMLDAVEGTAIDGLPRSLAWLRARPASFRTTEEAIAWATASGMLRSPAAAAVSMPSRLKWDAKNKVYTWRADILAAGPHLKEAFEGYTQIFVELKLPRMVVVGGLDHLDGALEAAHMQGKFKLRVLQHAAGHHLQEDHPHEVADMLIQYLTGLRRQEVAFARLAGPSPDNHKRTRENSMDRMLTDTDD